jgi:hypothetical protein
VLDFGTLLPFNTVNVPDANSWRVYYDQICEEQTRHGPEGAMLYPDQWAYFVWLPEVFRQFCVDEPDGWGIVEELPYEHMFVEVRREPVHFMHLKAHQVVKLLDLLARQEGCPWWVQRELELAVSREVGLPTVANDPRVERFLRGLFRR